MLPSLVSADYDLPHIETSYYVLISDSKKLQFLFHGIICFPSLEIGCSVAVQVCLLQIPVLVIVDAIVVSEGVIAHSVEQ